MGRGIEEKWQRESIVEESLSSICSDSSSNEPVFPPYVRLLYLRHHSKSKYLSSPKFSNFPKYTTAGHCSIFQLNPAGALCGLVFQSVLWCLVGFPGQFSGVFLSHLKLKLLSLSSLHWVLS